MIITGRNAPFDQTYSFDDCVKFLKRVGFDGIELCFEDRYFHPRPDYAEDYFIEHAVELCGELGMTIASVGNHLDYVNDDNMFGLIKKIITKTRKFGTDIFITSCPDPNNRKFFERDAYYAKCTNRLRELLELAQEHGVRVAIEYEVTTLIASTKDMLSLMEFMNMDNLVCNFDVGHAFLTDPDIYESIRQLGNKIVHAHIEGMNRGEHIHLLPGEGDMDLAKVIHTMADAGFDGAMALDLYIHDYAAVAEKSLKTIRNML